MLMLRNTLLCLFLFVCVGASSAMARGRLSVSILGDSYSTFTGFIPEGQPAYYYPQITSDRGDVSNVRQTWWWQLIKEGGYRLEVNDSYSGSTVSYFGYNDSDYSDRSFITRAPRLGHPDIILVLGAINDSWSRVKMGDYMYDDITRADLFTFRPALAKLFQTLEEYYPNVQVYFILSDGLRWEINESVETICGHFHIPCIKLHNIEKINGHPTIKGMKDIADQVLKAL